jgi:hypothetical protein
MSRPRQWRREKKTRNTKRKSKMRTSLCWLY